MMIILLTLLINQVMGEEKKIVMVDKSPITLNDVYRRMSINYFSKTLNEIIEEKLLINYAIKNGIKLENAEIENTFKNIKSRFKDEKEFKKELSSIFITEKDYQRFIEDQLLAQKALISILNIKDISDEDAKRYYEANKDQFKIPQAVKLRQIFVSSENEANDIYIALEAGANFEKLASIKSVDEKLKKSAGDIGYFTKGMLLPEIEKEVFSLENQKYTKPIKTGNGYSIFKVEEKRDERIIPFEESKERIKEMIKVSIINQNKQNVIEKLKSSAKIEFQNK